MFILSLFVIMEGFKNNQSEDSIEVNQAVNSIVLESESVGFLNDESAGLLNDELDLFDFLQSQNTEPKDNETNVETTLESDNILPSQEQGLDNLPVVDISENTTQKFLMNMDNNLAPIPKGLELTHTRDLEIGNVTKKSASIIKPRGLGIGKKHLNSKEIRKPKSVTKSHVESNRDSDDNESTASSCFSLSFKAREKAKNEFQKVFKKMEKEMVGKIKRHKNNITFLCCLYFFDLNYLEDPNDFLKEYGNKYSLWPNEFQELVNNFCQKVAHYKCICSSQDNTIIYNDEEKSERSPGIKVFRVSMKKYLKKYILYFL